MAAALVAASLGFAISPALSQAQDSPPNTATAPRKPAKAKTAAKTAPALACPRAQYPGDPVCDVNADDAARLPTASDRGQNAHRAGGPQWTPGDDENVSVGVKWKATNPQAGGPMSTEALHEQTTRGLPGASSSSSQGGVNLGVKF